MNSKKEKEGGKKGGKENKSKKKGLAVWRYNNKTIIKMQVG